MQLSEQRASAAKTILILLIVILGFVLAAQQGWLRP
jgi:hypothetical protein